MNQESIMVAEIRRTNSHQVRYHRSIKPIRMGYFHRVDVQVHGEAPKDFIRVYEYGRCLKRCPKGWPAHIAKVGQKYYPNESITEHLLTRLGQEMGVLMADSRLMWVRGQLRFLSEYFLGRAESLVHGAEIFAGYLAGDMNFVKEDDLNFVKHVEATGMSNEIFTIQVVEAALSNSFPNEAEEILQRFISLIAFDALVGNNDRHFFNWGIITHIRGTRAARFSPVYDTARALFWNVDEHGLEKHSHPNSFGDYIRKYARECYPKTGWDECARPNHFELIRKIFEERPIYREVLTSFAKLEIPELLCKLLDQEFEGLFSPLRKRFMIACLRERLAEYAKAITLG